MDLLKNAAGSIRVGVEDSTSEEPERLLSAIRNIHSGVLLFYKEALRRLSPPGSDEVLLKASMMPRQAPGGVAFVGQGRKTVDVHQIRERFLGLGIKTDWERFDRISRVRNDAEHHYSTVGDSQLRGLISDAFILVRDFMRGQLHENPRELLGEEAWQEMLQVSELFEKERQTCRDALESINWESEALSEGVFNLQCEACGSPLLQPKEGHHQYDDTMELQCRACGESEFAESFVPKAVAEALTHEMHLSQTDGNETPYVNCPECSVDAYVIAEARCAHCGHEVDHTCASCGMEILPEELDSSPLCGWCSNSFSKDD
jgi:hypothetical protein